MVSFPYGVSQEMILSFDCIACSTCSVDVTKRSVRDSTTINHPHMSLFQDDVCCRMRRPVVAARASAGGYPTPSRAGCPHHLQAPARPPGPMIDRGPSGGAADGLAGFVVQASITICAATSQAQLLHPRRVDWTITSCCIADCRVAIGKK